MTRRERPQTLWLQGFGRSHRSVPCFSAGLRISLREAPATRRHTGLADASMSADPNALLAFKQSNLKERVSARSSARVHRLGPIRRASGANSASLFPPTFIRSILRSSDAPTRRPPEPTARGVPRGDRQRRAADRGPAAQAGVLRGAPQRRRVRMEHPAGRHRGDGRANRRSARIHDARVLLGVHRRHQGPVPPQAFRPRRRRRDRGAQARPRRRRRQRGG